MSLDDRLEPQIMNNDTCVECGVNFKTAKQAILSDLLEIIGENMEQPRPLDEESKARFYRVGGQNFIKNQLRDKVKEYCK